MRVLMYYNNNDVRVQEMPVPEIGPGELLVKMAASGICGSDVMEWYRRDKVPLVLGHEVAGEVFEIGGGVDRFEKGDRVAVTHHVPCNTCQHCLRGNHTVCDTLLRGTHFSPGGFSEYIRVPTVNVDRGTFHIPDGVSYAEASFMEPLACVIRGQRNAGIKAGDTVLVMGCGISGLLHIGLARAMGAALVVGADSIPFRKAMAETMGAHHVLTADDDMNASLKKVNKDRLADIVIICYDGFIHSGLRAVEKGGAVLFFGGAPEGAALPIGINDIFWRTEIKLLGTYAGAPYDCDLALKMIASGGVPVMKTVTHRLGLGEGPKGFEAVCSPMEHDCVKVIIEPDK